MPGLFDDIGNASKSGRVYFDESGNFTLEILECNAGVSDFKKINFFGVEAKVLESTNPKYPVGSRVNWFVKLQPGTPALSNVREFVAVLTDTPYDDVDSAGTEMVISKEQPCQGTVLKAIAVKKKTQAGKDFTLVQWSRYDGDGEALKSSVK
mgnify:FL=1